MTLGGKIKLIVLGAVGISMMAAVISFWPTFSLIRGMEKAVDYRARYILYFINHKPLAEVVRKFAWPEGKISAYDRFGLKRFEGDNPLIPEGVWILNPTSVNIYDDRVDLEFGGALLHFGISVFQDGDTGRGIKNLGSGVWFYSENGRIPKKDF